MCGDAEYGRCEICGKESVLDRTYFYYDISCECCNKRHHEMVRHCHSCVPEIPDSIHPLIKAMDGRSYKATVTNVLPIEVQGEFIIAKLLKTRKMKPDKRLFNTKVYVGNHSKEILEKAFSLGFEWPDNTKEMEPYYMFPFLFFDCNGKITASMRLDTYNNAKEREVSNAYILGLEPIKECNFKIFDRVLMRDDNEGIWMPKLFGKFLYNQKRCFLAIDDSRHSQCIPYEGNEHLAYTQGNPCGKKEQTEDKQ